MQSFTLDPTVFCVCGAGFDSHGKFGQHWKVCKTALDAIATEYHRIAAATDSPFISQKNWNETHAAGLPSSAAISRHHGSWAHFQAAMTGGEVVDCGGGRLECLPAAPAWWATMLAPGERVSRHAGPEALYGILTRMVEIAHQEAAGSLSHWRNGDLWAQPEEIQSDAERWLAELRDCARAKRGGLAAMGGSGRWAYLAPWSPGAAEN